MYKKNQKENRNIKTKNKKEIVTLLKEGGENNRKVGKGRGEERKHKQDRKDCNGKKEK